MHLAEEKSKYKKAIELQSLARWFKILSRFLEREMYANLRII
jgi:hypothetical protein